MYLGLTLIWVRLHLQPAILKKLAYGLTVRLLPHLNPFLFGQLLALVKLGMTPKTQSADTVIVSLEPTPFAVPELVTMGGLGRALQTTVHAGELGYCP
jgi:hypothetical protein